MSPKRPPPKKLGVPRLSGRLLRMAGTLVSTRIGGFAAGKIIRGELGVPALDALPVSLRGKLALDGAAIAARPRRSHIDAALGAPQASTWAPTHERLTALYGDGRASPVDVLRALYSEAARLDGLPRPLSALHRADTDNALRDAHASLARYRAGAPLGPLDGVPILAKEQIEIEGLPAQLGTRGLPMEGARADATVIARLRARGAIIAGHTPMTELGMSPIGVNPHRRMPRNPHRDDCAAGGSSTGSAAAVSLGLSPLNVAADAAGSIRIPSALCGVFGLKPTYGLISRAGDGFEGTFDHLGPIGVSTSALAAFLEATVGADPRDGRTRGIDGAASGAYDRALGRGVRGLRIGVMERELAEAEPEIGSACGAALAELERGGATLVPVDFEYGAQLLTIAVVLVASEGFADGSPLQRRYAAILTPEAAITAAIVRGFSAADYADALTLREGFRALIATFLRDVDLLALPSTRIPAPPIAEREWGGGLLCAQFLYDLCRFMVLGSLCGLPSLTCPVGNDASGRPLGLQLVGDAFDEPTVLAAGAHLERSGVAHTRRPTQSARLC